MGGKGREVEVGKVVKVAVEFAGETIEEGRGGRVERVGGEVERLHQYNPPNEIVPQRQSHSLWTPRQWNGLNRQESHINRFPTHLG